MRLRAVSNSRIRFSPDCFEVLEAKKCLFIDKLPEQAQYEKKKKPKQRNGSLRVELRNKET